MSNLWIISILIVFISNLVTGQNPDCDAFGGCFCSTDDRSSLYLSWIAPDVGDYSLVCDPRQLGLTRKNDKIHISKEFNALVIIPLTKDPLNFEIVGPDDQMTTLRCKDFAEQDRENALVHKDSSVTKSPIVVQAPTVQPNLGYHVFVVHHNTTTGSWIQMPRTLCRHDITDPEFACLPINCDHCDPNTDNAEESEKIKACTDLKAQHWGQ